MNFNIIRKLLLVTTIAVFSFCQAGCLDCGDGKSAEESGAQAEDKAVVEKAPPEPVNDEYVIQSGDTLFVAFTELGATPAEVDRLVRSAKDIYNLAKIRVGRTIYYRLNDAGGFDYFRYDIDPENYFESVPGPEGYQSKVVEIPYTLSTQTLRLTLTRCLYCDADDAGWDVAILEQLAERVFAWDIDFYTDIREGDTLAVLVERKDLETGAVRYGRIQAATANVNGRFTAGVWFQPDPEKDGDFYDLDANSMRRPFLRSPLKFTRVSSGFTYKRKHPILKKVRPHLGVDFAAPPGTPVRAAADGTVILKGRNGGFGKQVKLRHANRYETWYAHLRSYAKSVRKGGKVKQGQVIGFVGSTGLSTGPHLDYRMKHRGKMVNPLRQKFLPGKPLAKEQQVDYYERALELLTPLGIPEEQIAALSAKLPGNPEETSPEEPSKESETP